VTRSRVTETETTPDLVSLANWALIVHTPFAEKLNAHSASLF